MPTAIVPSHQLPVRSQVLGSVCCCPSVIRCGPRPRGRAGRHRGPAGGAARAGPAAALDGRRGDRASVPSRQRPAAAPARPRLARRQSALREVRLRGRRGPDTRGPVSTATRRFSPPRRHGLPACPDPPPRHRRTARGLLAHGGPRRVGYRVGATGVVHGPWGGGCTGSWDRPARSYGNGTGPWPATANRRGRPRAGPGVGAADGRADLGDRRAARLGRDVTGCGRPGAGRQRVRPPLGCCPSAAAGSPGRQPPSGRARGARRRARGERRERPRHGSGCGAGPLSGRDPGGSSASGGNRLSSPEARSSR